MRATRGFAVVDTETTGIFTGFRHRIAELAVIQCDPDGTITHSWSTLLNPDRDLGSQAIHGIRAADVRRAPRFEQLASVLIELLSDRVIVAHNWPFDAMHLRAEFERMGIDTPFNADAGLCTMRAAGRAMPWSRRSLIECCAAAGLADRSWHTARADAEAAAELLAFFLRQAPQALALSDAHYKATHWAWPGLPRSDVTLVQRRPADHTNPHFLARLVDRIPRDGQPITDAYMTMLDGALLDRQISETEADGLLDIAHDLGLHKADTLEIHHRYLRELARAALADGVLTAGERGDLENVAALLGLDEQAVEDALNTYRHPAHAEPAPNNVSVGGLTLAAGDRVVLTGQMRRGRSEITADACQVGLQMMKSVSRQTKVVVAADPDSLSGKAKDARNAGVPVVGEEAFMRALDRLRQQRQ